jgi:hypothetical protein
MNKDDVGNVSSDCSECDFIPNTDTPLNMSLLDRFLCICTAKKVMVLGKHWEILGKFRMNLGTAKKTQMSTWYPEKYVGFFMISLPNEEVVFWIHSLQEMYTVSCNINTPKLPEGTILCLNYTEGLTMDGSKNPRMLIFDIISLNGRRVDNNAEERYHMLQQLYQVFFEPVQSITELFHLQWVGHYTHAYDFVDGVVKVDHKVGGVMAMTDNPLRPIRTLRIKLPMIVFDQKQFLQNRQEAAHEPMPVGCCRSIEAFLESNKEIKKNVALQQDMLPIVLPLVRVKRARKITPKRVILLRRLPVWFRNRQRFVM